MTAISATCSSCYGMGAISARSRVSLKVNKFDLLLYYASFTLLSLTNIVGSVNFRNNIIPTWEIVKNIIGFFAIVFLLVKLLFQKYSLKSLCFMASFLLIGLMVRIRTGDSTFFFLCLLSVACVGIKIKTLAKCSLTSCIAAIFLSVFCVADGAASNVTIFDSRALLGVRYSLGFEHPNVFGKVLITAGAAISIIYSQKVSRKASMIITVFGVISLLVADSRTATFALFILAIICLIGESRFLNVRKLAFATAVSYLLMIAFTLRIMIDYSPQSPICQFINSLFSYRPEFWHNFFSCYGSAPFGSELVSGNVLNIYGTDAQLDGSYAVMIIQYGAIASVAITVLILSYLRKISSSSIGKDVFIFFILLLVGFSEGYELSPIYNLFLIGIGYGVNSLSPGYFFK